MTGLRYRQSHEVVSRRCEEETVLVHLRTGDVFRLNRTADAIWEICSVPRSLTEIVSHLPDRSRLDEAVLRRDTESLLHDLVRQELLLIDRP